MGGPSSPLLAETVQRKPLVQLVPVFVAAGLAGGDGRHAVRQSRAYHVFGSPLEAGAAAHRSGGGARRRESGDAAVDGAVVAQPLLFGPDQQALGHEGVVQHRREAWPHGGVPLEQLVDQVLSFQGDVARHLVFPENDFGQCVLDRVCVERRAAHQEGVEHAAQRPDVRLQAVGAVRSHLRGDVVGGPTHGEVLLVWQLELSGEAEVADFNVHGAGQQQVGQGQVPVQDAMSV